MRVLLLSSTTGYQTRTFGEAAVQLGAEIVFATDRCDHLDDPWRDRAIPIRFHEEAASVAAIVGALGDRPVDGVLALGDRPTVIAAEVAAALGLPWHPPEAARAARDKRRTRERLTRAGLRGPWSTSVTIDADPGALATTFTYPLVVKPTVLSGSRGVMRADTPDAFVAAFERLRRLLRSADVRALRDPGADEIQIEGYIDGREIAVEGLLERGALRLVALFDKPDPLDGPFFEETIYVTPSRWSEAEQAAVIEAVERAARALGLWHGPIHAECRLAHRAGEADEAHVFVLEVAARPIGGLCARALGFAAPGGRRASFEEVLLGHAMGIAAGQWPREAEASGVMMIPIPRGGIYRGVTHVEDAARVAHVTGIQVSAKTDQRLVPLPEGASYLGFIFARAAAPADVEAALREAHARLVFEIDADIPLL